MARSKEIPTIENKNMNWTSTTWSLIAFSAAFSAEVFKYSCFLSVIKIILLLASSCLLSFLQPGEPQPQPGGKTSWSNFRAHIGLGWSIGFAWAGWSTVANESNKINEIFIFLSLESLSHFLSNQLTRSGFDTLVFVSLSFKSVYSKRIWFATGTIMLRTRWRDCDKELISQYKFKRVQLLKKNRDQKENVLFSRMSTLKWAFRALMFVMFWRFFFRALFSLVTVDWLL